VSNIFENEKTLGAALVGWYRASAGMEMEGFMRFVLPKKLMAELNRSVTYTEEPTVKRRKRKPQ